LGIEFFSTENPAVKAYYQSQKAKGGVLVGWVAPFSSAEGFLKSGDILLALDQVSIAEDGTFDFRRNERLTLSYLVTAKQMGEEIAATIIRDGKISEIKFPLHPFVNMVPFPHEFEKPPYYIYGGMVFTVLSVDLLMMKGPEWWKEAPPNFTQYLAGTERLNLKRKKEVVVLLDVLPDDVNVGYHSFHDEVITKVNDQEFSSFAEFVNLVERNSSKFIVFETDHKVKVILDTTDIKRKTQEILKRNEIPRQYSESVESWLKKVK
jgi:S1-C subfamily serine protease